MTGTIVQMKLSIALQRWCLNCIQLGAAMDTGLWESVDTVVVSLFCCAIAGRDGVEDLLVELMELVSGVSTAHADFSSKKQNGCSMFVIDSAVGRSYL